MTLSKALLTISLRLLFQRGLYTKVAFTLDTPPLFCKLGA